MAKTRFYWKLIPRLLVWIMIFCGVWLIYQKLAAAGMVYEWRWNRVWRFIGRFGPDGFEAGPMLKGLAMTAGIAALSLAFSTIMGALGAFFKLSPWPVCSFLARLYIYIWRNTPLLLQLFFIYFLVAPLLDFGPFWSAILALSAFEGAYMAELFRAALASVPWQQFEAALALGFSRWQALRLVIAPQALRNALPALMNQGVSIIKDTSLVSAIAVADLTMRSQAIVAETFLAFEVWLLAGAIYLALALCLVLPGMWFEKLSAWRQ